MTTSHKPRLKRGAQALLGVLGMLLAVSLGLAVFFDDAAVFSLADASGSDAAVTDVMVASVGTNQSALRSTSRGTGTFAGEGGRVSAVKPELGGLLLLASGITGFVYLALRRK